MAASLKRKRAVNGDQAVVKRRPTSLDDDADSALSDTGNSKRHSSPAFEGNESDEESEGQGEGSVHSNDEEWTGLGELPVDEETRPSGGHSGPHLNKPPRGEELRNIKDATELYRSTSFKLQIDALLPNIRPKYSRAESLDRFLLHLHSFLNGLPLVSPQHPLSASRAFLEQGVSVPYPLPLPTEDTNWNVAFEKPAEILLVGSWALRTSVKAKDEHKYSVDVAVAMPDSLFQEKDYLHSRFFHKRAYYLAVIAAAISDKKSGLNLDVLYESRSADPRFTNLVLRPRKGESANDFCALNAEVRLIPVLSTTSPIPLARLSPSRSNIRISDEAKDTPTPLYNSAILLSMTYKQHLLSMHNMKEAVPAFADALALLRVWGNQRGYGVGDRLCVRGFEGRGMLWASVLALLVYGEEPSGSSFGKPASKRKPLGKRLSSYQLFKATLDFLAKHDFARSRVFVKSGTGHRFPPEDYNSHEAVLVDSSSMLNLLAGVPLSSLEMLRYDAQQTLDILDSYPNSEDPFNLVFLKERRDISSRFDVIIRLDLSSAKLRKPSPHAILEHGSAYNALIATMVTLLREGLGNRSKAIAVLHPSSSPRPRSEAHPSNPSIVYLGLILDTEHAFRLVDHGPPASEQETEAAQKFRDFWGEKAELRRFKDGSIVESVVWTVNNLDERAQIPTLIVRHIVKRHCGITDDAVHAWQSQFDSALRLPESIVAMYQSANAPIGFKAAMSAFDNVVKAMKALDDQLPLAILNVSPVAESLRYTSVHSPVSVPGNLASILPPSARYLAPMEITIEFEKSGRWPDDLRAIQKIKLAFFETLASALMNAQKGLQASVVVHDNGPSSEIRDQASLDIVTADGWAFTARIWHDREATLLERIINDKPHVPRHLSRQMQDDPKERQAAVEAQELYRRRFIHAPRHHRAIAALCHRFSAFSGTVRLVKRWLAAHWLLRGHVREEVVELLCASVFLRHGAGARGDATADHRAGVPGSKERGFALVIELLKDWEWNAGMFVPLYGTADEASPSGQPAVGVTAGAKTGVWAVATEVDPDGHAWTSAGPDAIVARRVKALAEAAWECLRGVESSRLDVMTLFAHPTEHYDFIVELDPATLPRYHQNVHADEAVWAKKGKYANARSNEDDARLLPGFDPAQLLYDDLKNVYKDTFVLFHDPLGGDRYGAVWVPTLKTPRPFRILGGFSSMPVRRDTDKPKDKDKSLVVLNESAVLSEVGRMGSGLMKRIVLQV